MVYFMPKISLCKLKPLSKTGKHTSPVKCLECALRLLKIEALYMFYEDVINFFKI